MSSQPSVREPRSAAWRGGVPCTKAWGAGPSASWPGAEMPAASTPGARCCPTPAAELPERAGRSLLPRRHQDGGQGLGAEPEVCPLGRIQGDRSVPPSQARGPRPLSGQPRRDGVSRSQSGATWPWLLGCGLLIRKMGNEHLLGLAAWARLQGTGPSPPGSRQAHRAGKHLCRIPPPSSPALPRPMSPRQAGAREPHGPPPPLQSQPQATHTGPPPGCIPGPQGHTLL